MIQDDKDYTVRVSFYNRPFEDLELGTITFLDACDEALNWLVAHEGQEPVAEIVQSSTGRVRKEYREREAAMVAG